MKYKLKHEIDMLSFLKTVEQCEGEVIFEGQKGERLDLKSRLSRYLLLTVSPDDAELAGSTIDCSGEDIASLSEYLTNPGNISR